MLPESTSPVTEALDSSSSINDNRFTSKEDNYALHLSEDENLTARKEETSNTFQSSGKIGIYLDAKLETFPTVVETFSISDVAAHSIPQTDSYFYTSTFEVTSKDSLESIDRYMPEDRADDDTEREDECPNQDSLYFTQTRVDFHNIHLAMERSFLPAHFPMERRTRILESCSSDSMFYNAARDKSLFDDDGDDDKSVDLNHEATSAESLPQIKPICSNPFTDSSPSFRDDNKSECNLKNISFQPVLDYTSTLQVRK
jgi:hypothetical protein